MNILQMKIIRRKLEDSSFMNFLANKKKNIITLMHLKSLRFIAKIDGVFILLGKNTLKTNIYGKILKKKERK